MVPMMVERSELVGRRSSMSEAADRKAMNGSNRVSI